mmetsp:Transcript_27519/g.87456  ORF Transcript_27519/g.87456 Transcript_27519/m.87456 type:complete len:252 (-) Transcript_27519:6-761(-)
MAAVCAEIALFAERKCALTSAVDVSSVWVSCSALARASLLAVTSSAWTASNCATLALSCCRFATSPETELSWSLVSTRSWASFARPLPSPKRSSFRAVCLSSRLASFTSRSVAFVWSSLLCWPKRTSTCCRRSSVSSRTLPSSESIRSVLRCAAWMATSCCSTWARRDSRSCLDCAKDVAVSAWNWRLSVSQVLSSTRKPSTAMTCCSTRAATCDIPASAWAFWASSPRMSVSACSSILTFRIVGRTSSST